jgi:Spy/CpxP family protein refolding chaperone
LSDEQVSQLEQLEADVTAAREKAIADARTHQDALVEAFQAARPDENTIRTHAQAIVQARQAAEVQAITTHARAKAVLTAEQQAKMEGWVAGQRMGRAGAVGRGAGMRGIRGMRPGMGMRRMPGAGWRF